VDLDQHLVLQLQDRTSVDLVLEDSVGSCANTSKIDMEAGFSGGKSSLLHWEAKSVWKRRNCSYGFVIAGIIIVIIVWGADTSFLSAIAGEGSQESTTAEFYTFRKKSMWESGGATSCASKIQAKSKAAYERMMLRRKAAYGDGLPYDENEAYFYYAPSYSCPFEERVGNSKDGGIWVCDPTSLNSESIVYSVGSNGEMSFETQLHQICNGCKIHMFDNAMNEAGMKPIRDAEAAGVLTFHPFGFAVSDNPELPVKPLQDSMAELNHKFIDIFKIDCEGCEWEFFDKILKTFPPILFGQVLVELHPFFDADRTNRFLKLMEEKGYMMFHYETNVLRRHLIQVAFIHKSVVNMESRK
jgi:hypothetical protein